ncbi:MAG: Lrp/AsnC family transcriptional regulator [Nanoarchaeota archaeon]|nr:Lrp/AsnC family transcriptional regulator [Nanoarchaeota archaeon]
MNQNEKEILKRLRHGKKANISKIARELCLPISTVSDRIKRIDEKYVIKRSSLIDFQNSGYFAHELLALKANSSQKGDLLQYLKAQNCVNTIYATNTDYSYLIEIVCKDHLELVNWLGQLKSMFEVDFTSYQILKIEEKEKFIP